MNKLYLNEISNEKTLFPYRFKIRTELISDYGEDWEKILSNKGASFSVVLFGEDFDVDKDKNEIDRVFDTDGYYKNWFFNTVIKDMLILNKVLPESKIVYINNISKKQTKYPYRFKTEQEFINEYGNEWYYGLPDYGWVDEMDYLLGEDLDITTNKEYIDDFIQHDGGSIDCTDGFVATKHMLLPNIKFNEIYNTPRQLVYEKLKSDIYDILVVKCNSKDEFNRVQEFAFEKGYEWATSNLYQDSTFILLKHKKEITKMTNRTDEYMIDYLDRIYYGEYIIVNGLNGLKLLYGPDYNTPRQLVYESKIFKFNKFKKGE